MGPALDMVRVLDTDDSLAGVSADAFLFGGRAASFAVAFISPHADFEAVAFEIRRLAGKTPLVAASTAGELCAASDRAPLYKPTGSRWSTVIVQIFSPDLLEQVGIRTIPLHSEDFRHGARMAAADRTEPIIKELQAVRLPFRLDAGDTVALTFIDGLSACENYLMEAVYRSSGFPCLFVGGSAGGKFDFQHTYLFDGQRVLENHAVIAFLKLAPGKRYGVLKSQNFRKTGHSFVVVDADPDRRTVSTFLDEKRGVVVPATEALAKLFCVSPDQLLEKLTGHTFAIELDGELFVRSIAGLDLETGKLTFFCDVNQGEELLLVEATDFVEQTRKDVAAFLRGKPKPLAAILNDCILRRLNNEKALGDLGGLWSVPAAGFSTFGELLGININQTLTALVFFDATGAPFEDEFVDSFPIHYARFCSYFERRQLNRIEIMARLRAGIVKRLAEHLGTGSAFARQFETLLTPSTDVRSTLESIHAALAREAAREREVRALKTRYEMILEAAGDGIIGIDARETITFANRAAGAILGVSSASLEGRDYRTALSGSGNSADFPRFPLPEAAPESREGVFRRGDGGAFIAEYGLAPILQQGRFEGAVLAFRDISLRKRYEASLADHQRELERQVEERTRKLTSEIDIRRKAQRAFAESQERLVAITESLVVGVFLVDHTGVVVFANKAARGYLDADAILERRLDEILTLETSGAGLKFADGPFRKIIDTGETIIDDDAVFIFPASGRRLSVAYAAAPLVEGERRRIAIVSFREIEALKKARREAQQASHLATIGQLAAGIAHEINTPVQYVGNNLAYIGQSLSALREVAEAGSRLAADAAGSPELSEPAARYDAVVRSAHLDLLWQELPGAVSESLEGVDQITRIVNSMKEFSHPGTTRKSMVDVNRAIESTLTVCRNIWKVVADVETDFDPDLPPIPCFGGEMNQVYLNLIVNAAHAIETAGKPLPGKIRIVTRRAGDFVTIDVCDNGTGIPLDLRERIFDPFFTTKEVGKGTGQGLAICRDVIVSKHGGTLEAGGVAGESAVFTIRLPMTG